MCKKIFIILITLLIHHASFSQVVLEANGPGDTYELINSVLTSPGGEVVEVPDCGHQEFGRHIDEVYDTELRKYVFRFHIHVTPDNDRCMNYDRQRTEIKTYDKSPDNLIGTEGEVVRYKWKFKLDSDFQPSGSFTHLHQLKSVGSDEDSMPLITLTARKGTPDQLEIRYAETYSQITLKKIELEPLKGTWVEVTETVTYGEKEAGGQYHIEIKTVNGNEEILNYNNNIRTWKTDADFIRPKWGIYRSLNDKDNLRDEIVLFADFSVEEICTTINSPNETISEDNIYPNPGTDSIFLNPNLKNIYTKMTCYDINGRVVLQKKITTQVIDVSILKPGIYFLHFSNNNEVSRPYKLIIY
ncbi:T9SS type A sorting domain-containing protein [Anaerophaga thermohalophila]|uniref:T9SS type A sorting domain-containing protein n=1 Tax=Anaerophaga thermohalophila TaxID=177400 RepID=UPI000237C0B7|nr:T9SS type A sorting domain-containing protein [Anaerophaga thermohalophila]